MMENRDHEVFPEKRAKYLLRRSRRILQSPRRILGPWIKDGMTVVDYGCGPGFFAVEAAKLVGENGKVIAVDIQQGMLDMLAERIKGTGLEKRIILQKPVEKEADTRGTADVFIAFHVVHELSDKPAFFRDAADMLKPGDILYLSEPKHRVSKKEFLETVEIAEKCGFEAFASPAIFLDRTVVMKNKDTG